MQFPRWMGPGPVSLALCMGLWIVSAPASAPLDPAGEQRLRSELGGAVHDAEALGHATGLALNAAPATAPADCASDEAQVVARAGAFASAWGEAVADLVTLSQALRDARDLPTLKPLRSRDTAKADAQLLARADRTVAAQAGASAAFRRRFSVMARRCPTEVTPGAGWARPGAVARDDPAELHAVWVTRAGSLCTLRGGTPVEPGPVLLEVSAVCRSDSPACGCTPEPVLAGAAL